MAKYRRDAHHSFAEEEGTLLNAKASAEGFSAEQCAGQLLKEALSAPVAEVPLSSRIRQLWSAMPDEVRAKSPADGASQHHHYLYGVPKREN